jgi:hypothetical protein
MTSPYSEQEITLVDADGNVVFTYTVVEFEGRPVCPNTFALALEDK